MQKTYCIFLIAVVLVAGVSCACTTGQPDTTGGVITNIEIFKNNVKCVGDGACDAKLLETTSGSDNTCPGGGGAHFWPLYDSATDCHGWRSDANGETHDNSANNIRCSTDGLKMLYTQFAGNVDCSGTGTDKEYVLNECHQGIPQNLYDKGVDFGCCSDTVQCIDNCAACADTTTCTTCDVGFFGDGTTSCSSCPGNCDVCSDGTLCTTCKDGYSKDSANNCYDCAVCAAEFVVAGGCPVLESGGDTSTYISDGCDSCGSQAEAACEAASGVTIGPFQLLTGMLACFALMRL